MCIQRGKILFQKKPGKWCLLISVWWFQLEIFPVIEKLEDICTPTWKSRPTSKRGPPKKSEKSNHSTFVLKRIDALLKIQNILLLANKGISLIMKISNIFQSDKNAWSFALPSHKVHCKNVLPSWGGGGM